MYGSQGLYNLLFKASILMREGPEDAPGFDKLIHTSAESLLCFRPLVPAVTSPMRRIWRKEQLFSAAAALFLEERKETARDEQKPFYEN